MSNPKDIPVCTLFNDQADNSASNLFPATQSDSSAATESDQKPTSFVDDSILSENTYAGKDDDESSISKPSMCNLFQSELSTEDLFSTLAVSSQENQQEIGDANSKESELQQKEIDDPQMHTKPTTGQLEVNIEVEEINECQNEQEIRDANSKESELQQKEIDDPQMHTKPTTGQLEANIEVEEINKCQNEQEIRDANSKESELQQKEIDDSQMHTKPTTGQLEANIEVEEVNECQNEQEIRDANSKESELHQKEIDDSQMHTKPTTGQLEANIEVEEINECQNEQEIRDANSKESELQQKEIDDSQMHTKPTTGQLEANIEVEEVNECQNEQEIRDANSKESELHQKEIDDSQMHTKPTTGQSEANIEVEEVNECQNEQEIRDANSKESELQQKEIDDPQMHTKPTTGQSEANIEVEEINECQDSADEYKPVQVEKPKANEVVQETNDIFGDGPSTLFKVEDVKDPPDLGNVENTPNALNNSDLMSSILINDSLDNLSNISFDQGTTGTSSESVACESKPSEINDQAEEASEDVSSTDAPLPSTARFLGKKSKPSPPQKKKKTDAENRNKNETTASFTTPSASSRVEKNNMFSTASELFTSIKEGSPFDNFNRSSSVPEDDAFTNALHTSEVDRRRDAWIPNEQTQLVLDSVMQSQKRVQLEPRFLSLPGLATSESLGDPIKAVLARHKGLPNTISRQTLSVDSVSLDKSGLEKLVNSGNHRAAVDLCGRKLESLGQGFGSATQPSVHSPESLKWWHARFSLLLRLEMHELAQTEFEQFGSFETADLFYNFYPDLYPGRKGSMVPFSLRLLYADFPRHRKSPRQSLQRLYYLESMCTKIVDNLSCHKSEDGNVVKLKENDKKASLKLWTGRKVKVVFMIYNVLNQLGEFYSAVVALDQSLSLAPENEFHVHSAVGRMLLKLGDIKSAQERFAKAERCAGNDVAHQIQLLSNRSILYLGANNWKEALKQLNEVLHIDPNNIEALNNKAVCLLYLCRLRDAIATQEQAVKLNKPPKPLPISEEVLYESAISNLVTLYELESSKSSTKKQAVLQHVSVRNGDGFNTECLKM